MLDIEKVFLHNGIPIASGGQRHYRQGWLNTPCPFCTGNPGNHLGWNVNQQYFVCIRCGWKPVDQVLAALISNEATLKTVLQDYKVTRVKVKAKDKIATATKCKLPWNQPLNKRARSYLRGRRFNPAHIAHLWDICSTHEMSTTMFQNRIIAPIYSQGRLVSFQTRDITNRANLRYITASKEEEVIHHKHLLYGMDQVPTDSMVVVEGITDVWRLGFGAVCTFGIKYTNYQLLQLAKFRNRFVLFDTQDKQAKKQGRKLAEQLGSFDGETFYVELPKKYRGYDPADLPQKEADALMLDLKN